jgi:hypothetical protein
MEVTTCTKHIMCPLGLLSNDSRTRSARLGLGLRINLQNLGLSGSGLHVRATTKPSWSYNDLGLRRGGTKVQPWSYPQQRIAFLDVLENQSIATEFIVQNIHYTLDFITLCFLIVMNLNKYIGRNDIGLWCIHEYQ